MKVVNVVVLAAFLLLDCYYFLRILFVVLHAKLVAQRKSPLDVFVTRGVCLTTDLDCSCHMNNARYLRELDFARTHMLFSSGLWKTLKHLKAGVVVGSNTIRYRREINLFQLYNIHTQIKYWDEKSLYIEQRYINTKDKFVFAIAIICFRVLSKHIHYCNIKVHMIRARARLFKYGDSLKVINGDPISMQNWCTVYTII
ncbi:PREDICTED: protein THEM6-like isoform X1 [Priapulus caudatus]|uniref:Protein THEM6 n=1 Tax=Priapulus caudatus TaxID=37621 RepID=A0ABM1E9Y6_PRICU|nr:PREDICTED: protein THEM6-like isoform X1 [Priapulus caudatus]